MMNRRPTDTAEVVTQHDSVVKVRGLVNSYGSQAGPLPSSDTPTHPARRRRQGARGRTIGRREVDPGHHAAGAGNFRERPPSTNQPDTSEAPRAYP
jgi:hypothetical protein